MRVLLTGAAGFIGTRVTAALAEAGHQVVAVDAMLPAAHGPGAQLPVGVRRVDVRDSAALAPLLKGVDVVCHQAAVVGAGVERQPREERPRALARGRLDLLAVQLRAYVPQQPHSQHAPTLQRFETPSHSSPSD